jgi:hypothetical protein
MRHAAQRAASDMSPEPVGVFPAAESPTAPQLLISHPGLTYGGIVHDGSVHGASMLGALGDIAEH